MLVPCSNLIATNNTLSVERCWQPFVFDVFTMVLIQRLCVDHIGKKRKKTFLGNIYKQGTDTVNRKKECAYLVYIHMRICTESWSGEAGVMLV